MSVQPRPSIHDQEENDYIYDDSLVTESGESQFEEDDQMYDSENEGNLSVNLRRDKFEMSRSVPRTPPRPKPPKYQRSPTPRYTPESYRRKPMEDNRSPSSCSSPPLIFILAIVIGLFSAGYFVYANRTTKPLLECSYEKLQIQYPEQSDNVWRTLRAGAEVILNKIKTEPAVYLFVHNDNSSERVLNMVKNIALHTSNCFGKLERLFSNYLI